MKFTAEQIAGMVKGVVAGNPQESISTVSKIEEGTPGSISFLANPKYTHFIYETRASIVIVNNDFVPEHPVNCTLIKVESAQVAFGKLLELYNQIRNDRKGISPQAFISGSAKIGDSPYVGEFVWIGENVVIGNNVKLYPQVYIGDNTTIGDNTVLYPGVKIYSDIVIGKNCMFHAGTVISPLGDVG